MSTPTELRLRPELRQARELTAALEERRLALQEANEGAYRAAYDASGGARFDKLRPFGRLTERCFPDPVKRAAFRMLQQRTGAHDA
ncbi:hypothetical protein AB0D73_27340 [Streptomyces sp. NPDC048215]|uniref:hypothetical protein n=1 Tax=Streptomyces sp. NPDC048215 TaxID=3156690 RepID=UPI0033FC65D8